MVPRLPRVPSARAGSSVARTRSGSSVKKSSNPSGASVSLGRSRLELTDRLGRGAHQVRCPPAPRPTMTGGSTSRAPHCANSPRPTNSVAACSPLISATPSCSPTTRAARRAHRPEPLRLGHVVAYVNDLTYHPPGRPASRSTRRSRLRRRAGHRRRSGAPARLRSTADAADGGGPRRDARTGQHHRRFARRTRPSGRGALVAGDPTDRRRRPPSLRALGMGAAAPCGLPSTAWMSPRSDAATATWNLWRVVAARAGGRAVVVKATAPFLGDEPRAVDLLGRFAPGGCRARPGARPDPADHGDARPARGSPRRVPTEDLARNGGPGGAPRSWPAHQEVQVLAIGRDLRAEAVLATASPGGRGRLAEPKRCGAPGAGPARASLGARLDRLAKCGIPARSSTATCTPGNWFGPPGGLRRTALHLLEPVRLWLAADLFGGFLRSRTQRGPLSRRRPTGAGPGADQTRQLTETRQRLEERRRPSDHINDVQPEITASAESL